jgi:uncharacterized lipoprotein YajG
MRFTIIGAAFCALALSGCAFSEDVVSVPYAAQGSGQSGAGIKVATAVVDARTGDRGRISSKINGFDQELAAIRSDRDVTAIVKDAFGAELQSRGYSVGPGEDTATISVKRFYSMFKQGVLSGEADADVQFNVVVTGADGIVRYRHDFSVTGIAPDIILANGSNAAVSLSDGLKKAFAAIFADQAFLAALKGPAAPVAAAGTALTPNS